MLFDQMTEFQCVGGLELFDKRHEPNVVFGNTFELLAWPCGNNKLLWKIQDKELLWFSTTLSTTDSLQLQTRLLCYLATPSCQERQLMGAHILHELWTWQPRLRLQKLRLLQFWFNPAGWESRVSSCMSLVKTGWCTTWEVQDSDRSSQFHC